MLKKNNGSKRPGSITAICIILLIVATLTVLLTIFEMLPINFIPYLPNLAIGKFGLWQIPYQIIYATIQLVCVVGLWQMKKWGLIIYIFFAIINLLVLIISGNRSIFILLIPLTVVIVGLQYFKLLNSTQNISNKKYENYTLNTVISIILLFLLFPIGLIFMWLATKWSRRFKYFLTIFFPVFFVAIFVLIGLFPDKWQGLDNKIISISQRKINNKTNDNDLALQILPSNGVNISIQLNDLGERMIQDGVIDKGKIDALYTERGSKEEIDRLLTKSSSSITLTKDNANLYLNFFWALGLGNKNTILTQGPMIQNGDPAKFASTGGWTLSKGQTMDHYAKYDLINLTSDQQKIVEDIAKNIYRPCCGNSVYFPDCNHGMAMLGFLELMASQSKSEKEIYKNALVLNSFWFPNQYLTIGEYFKENNKKWIEIDPKIILSKNYSSQQGFASISSKVKNLPFLTGGGVCGV